MADVTVVQISEVEGAVGGGLRRLRAAAGGETHALGGDTAVRVGPGLPRRIRSGGDGLRVLAIGGVPGAAYRALVWTELGGPDPQPRIAP